MTNEEWDGVSPLPAESRSPEQQAEAEKNLVELRELTARMAADEASEGNFAAAAELQRIQMSEVPGHTTTVQEELDNALARIKELQAQIEKRDADAKMHVFVEKSLDRLKPQLARRIAEVIMPEYLESGEEEAVRAAAQRLVDEGLRFVPTSEEMEAVEQELRFIVAATADQQFLPTWDGQLYGQIDDPQLQREVAAVREQINRAGTRAPEAATWAAFALMRVPDELVFGTENPEAGRG